MLRHFYKNALGLFFLKKIIKRFANFQNKK